jgi:hypothetical protein
MARMLAFHAIADRRSPPAIGEEVAFESRGLADVEVGCLTKCEIAGPKSGRWFKPEAAG